MKKILCLLMAAGAVSAATAQDSVKQKRINRDALLPAFCVDLNFKGGMLAYDMTTANFAGNYKNSILPSIGSLEFKDGMSYGGDIQLGYFFGKKRHWGVGAGFMYMSQTGNLNMDKFHIEYQSTDYTGATFRQLITAKGPIKEELKMTSMQIPVVLKYKNQFSKKWGFAADAGILYNVQMTNKFTTNASYDYEAIYNYRLVDGAPVAYYDNSPTPGASAWLLTNEHYTDKNPTGNIVDTFNRFRAQGYNVGLNVQPNSKTGETKYTQSSIGFMVNPSVSYLLGSHVALHLGVYYAYQTFKNDNTGSYRTTDKVGEYNSMVKGISNNNTSNYGVNVGLRIYMASAKDADHDGIPDRKDNCPEIAGVRWFQGCPDRDGDSVMDKDDMCPDVKGLIALKGCPDTDGDGIADKDDECPYVAGLASLNGCPDKDGDGIADKNDACPNERGSVAMRGCPDRDNDGIADNEDACPDKPGNARFNGCPDTDNDGTPDNKDKCIDVAGPAENDGCPVPVKPEELDVDMIQFKTGTSVIMKSSYHILDDAIKVLKKDPNAVLALDGYTDITGGDKINIKLSKDRAESVKRYFLKKGVKANKLVAEGHGSADPIDDNNTEDGRAKNRRVVMSIRYNNN